MRKLTGDVVIAGLGLAGSLLSLRLAERGFKVTAFEPVEPSYVKPCGEQLTLEELPLRLAKAYDVIKTIVNFVHVFVEGKYITTTNMSGNSRWAIIDKPRLIMSLRRSALDNGVDIIRRPWNGERGALTIDSRGPYNLPLSSEVLALRVIAKVPAWSSEEAILDFRPSSGGLYWVFPYDDSGHLINVGAGFVGLYDAVHLEGLVRGYIKEKISQNFDVLEVKGAPINVFTNPSLSTGDIINVGEAAGLVMAWSGEGNRPSIVSAEALVGAISSYGIEDRTSILKKYSEGISSLLSSAVLSRLLTRASYRSPLAEGLLRNMPKWAWDLYVRQELGLDDFLRAAPQAIASMLARREDKR